MQSSKAPVRATARAGPRGPDFIGIGAQRTGTSWIYACLYEHPRLCLPRKEINFFSRERNWSRGFEWYEGIFAECPPNALAGEFCTSYLSDTEAPERIRDRYPQVRLIVSLRHPADRAYSSYLNDIVAGAVPPTTGFREALQSHPEYVEAGRYARYLTNYLDLFPRGQLLVSIFDDARRDPLGAIRETYRFLDVDPTFRPTMLDRRVGIGRVPRSQRVERWLIDTSAALSRQRALRPLWWRAKRLGLGDRLRALNTAQSTVLPEGLDPEERRSLIREFEPEISALEKLLEMELPGWRR
jgi:Sulfotransferase domain